MPNDDFQIAALLVNITETVLWPHIQPWLRANNHCIQLRCRVGRGQATHHTQQGQQHTLTFGRKMVASKRCARQARNWTTGRELVGRGYFSGNFGYAELMAHTCCHEFAHLVQSLNGWYRRGSIHNADFYRILDQMHQGGIADRVLQVLQLEADRQGLQLEFAQGVTADGETSENRAAQEIQWRMPVITGISQQQLKEQLQGQLAEFDYRGRKVQGRITRVHRKTVRIEDHGVRGIDYFRVPPSQLQLVDSMLQRTNTGQGVL